MDMENSSGKLSKDVSEYNSNCGSEKLKTFIHKFLLKNEKLIASRVSSNGRWLKKYFPEYHDIINSYSGGTLTQKIYNLYYDHIETFCPVCENKLKFVSFYYGYEKGCSPSCRGKNAARNIVEKYGMPTFHRNDIKIKIKNTNLIKYGVDCPLKSPTIQGKIKDTILIRYGFDNPAKSPQVIAKIKAVQKLSKDAIISSFPIDFQIVSLPENVSGIISFYCDRGHYNEMILDNWLRRRRCGKCNIRASMMEKEINEFLSQYTTTITNNRTILDNMELDIYLPEKHIAVEFNGLFWHSRLDKQYHVKKTEECLLRNINLIHIFEDEWLFKKDIIKSILLNKIGKTPNKIHARKCKIVNVSSDMKNTFLNLNHIQGSCTSTTCVGLTYNDDLVALMSFGNRKITSKNVFELLRYCSKLNYVVMGGPGKLFSGFVSQNNINKIVSYADRRFYTGTMYENLGFKLKSISKPNYFYFRNDLKRYHRVTFQKHKLKNKLNSFDPDKTEVENMTENGWRRIWDCGNLVYEWNR